MDNKQSVELEKLLKSMAKIPRDLDKRFIKIFGKIGNLCSSLSRNGGFVRENFGVIDNRIEAEQKQTEIFDNCTETCKNAISNWKKSDSDNKKAFLINVSTKVKTLDTSCLKKELGDAFESVATTLELLSRMYK